MDSRRKITSETNIETSKYCIGGREDHGERAEVGRTCEEEGGGGNVVGRMAAHGKNVI